MTKTEDSAPSSKNEGTNEGSTSSATSKQVAASIDVEVARAPEGRALVAADLRRRLHGDDREPPVQLDAVRHADPEAVPLGSGADPDRVRRVRLPRDLAGAGRGLAGR